MSDGSRAGLRFNPRIYYLHPLIAGALSDWPTQLRRIAAMGFDHVLLPPPFAPSHNGKLLLTADFSRLHPALGWRGDADAGLRAITQAARDAGLAVLLDVVLDRAAIDGRDAQDHPSWLRSRPEQADLPPDPRVQASWHGASALRLEDATTVAQVQQAWGQRLSGWLDAGIAGFCLQSPQHLPRQLIQGLIREVRSRGANARFLADTTHMGWQHHAALEGLGLDAVFASTPWWDFSTGWLVDEHARLARIAPVITAPEAPFATRAAARVPRQDLAEKHARRLLRLAAATGCGWLMPMGFEFGARDPLPATQGSPQDLAAWRAAAPFDLSDEIGELNRALAADSLLAQPAALVALSSAGAPVATLLRTPAEDTRGVDEALLIAADVDLQKPASVAPSHLLSANAAGLSEVTPWQSGSVTPLALDAPVELDGGELQLYRVRRNAPIMAPAITRTRRAIDAAMKVPRVAIENITPAVDSGVFVVKRVVGDIVQVEADAFMDGHDHVAVALLWKPADESTWREVRMRPLGNDRWAGEFPLERMGRYQYTVESWRDAWESYRHEIEKKHQARLRIGVELEEGLQLLADAITRAGEGPAAQLLRDTQAQLKNADEETRFRVLASDAVAQAMKAADARAFSARHEPALNVDAERPGARFASWYELFPRSMSGDADRHGTFIDVIKELPRIRDMGFDVLYFPPIHPIGEKHRKGRNNTLTAGPDDPGSPYAIGNRHGDYEAVDPRLGTLDDFRKLRDAAREQGLELALDFAIQCAPDHPWLKDHPDWFAWRPDGTIKYAENPPKKYEDIVNVDFYAEGAMPGLWLALRDAVLFWCNEGVKLFRVDNPHTKPLPFWKWMIADVRGRYPDAVFLAEAFTRPKLMRRLAKVGYSQSYTYFTWRNTKAELTEYLTELNETQMREYFRPHFFVNTPDINPYFLQATGRNGHLIRAALAATLSGLWGVYSGFELCEATPLPKKEEYLDSEKYQIRVWDWDRPGNISGEIALLNRLRKRHPALQTHLGLRFVHCDNGQVLLYQKATLNRDDVLLIAVSLDPHHAQGANFELPLWEFGLPDHATLAVEDVIRGQRLAWTGKHQSLHITPDFPFAIWRLQAA